MTTFVNMPRSLEHVTNEHIKRYYGEQKPPELTEFDNRLISTIMKINNAYQEDMKKRKYTVLVTEKEGQQLYSQNDPNCKAVEKIELKPKQEQAIVRRCEHLKKDGIVCNCLIKDPLAQFCGTHSRKKK